jgi:hypothetical protein
MANTIVCGIDGSKESVAAAEVGVWLAAALEAIPIFVNAVDEATASPQSQSAAVRRAQSARWMPRTRRSLKSPSTARRQPNAASFAGRLWAPC